MTEIKPILRLIFAAPAIGLIGIFSPLMPWRVWFFFAKWADSLIEKLIEVDND